MTLYRKLLHKVPEVEVLKQAGTDNVEAHNSRSVTMGWTREEDAR